MIQHASKYVLSKDSRESTPCVGKWNIGLPELLNRAVLIAADTQRMHVFEGLAIFNLILYKSLCKSWKSPDGQNIITVSISGGHGKVLFTSLYNMVVTCKGIKLFLNDTSQYRHIP